MRERDKTPGGDPAQAILHPVDLFLPNGLAEPDLEAIHTKPSPPCGKKMTELVDKDDNVEKRYHDEEEEKVCHS